MRPLPVGSFIDSCCREYSGAEEMPSFYSSLRWRCNTDLNN